MTYRDNLWRISPRGIRNVLYLGIVSFFTDFSTEMILGVLPTFIVNNLGASRAILGAIEGSSELTSYAFRMISGSLSDKFRKKKIIVWSIIILKFFYYICHPYSIRKQLLKIIHIV